MILNVFLFDIIEFWFGLGGCPKNSLSKPHWVISKIDKTPINLEINVTTKIFAIPNMRRPCSLT